MAVVQSSYLTGYANGYPGMIADGEEGNRISRTLEDSTSLPFGKAVFRGTGDHGCTATPSANLYGIAIANYAAPAVQATGAEADSYPQYASVGILTQGQIWVTAGASTTAGAQVYVTSAGVFTPTSTSNTLLTGWSFDDTVSSGAVVRIARR